MRGSILHKELLELRRDRRTYWLAAIVLGLMAAAAINGVERAHTAATEKAAAEEADRIIWHEQGEKNPHSAAHFARYAFKPVPALSFFDPGVIDYAGLAVWMEAHHQNPPVFRAAEDGGTLARSASLSPAWILRFIGPLLLILLLYSVYAAERQRGTLRQLLSSGTSPAVIFRGKLGLAVVLVGAIVATTALATAIAMTALPGVLPDSGVRALILVLSYGGYLLLFAFLAVAVSVVASSPQAALSWLLITWAAVAVLLPRVATDMGERISPSLTGQEIRERLSAGTAAWRGDEGKAVRERIKGELLARHGVDDVADLPVNYDAIMLQASEEFANPRFDRVLEEIWARYDGQAQVVRAISVLSPVIAMERLSAALSGTDLAHHRAFVDAAERHRRILIAELNQDMAENAGSAGYDYKASAELWKKSPEFHHVPPSFSAIAGKYWPEMAILFVWLLFAAILARRAAYQLNPAEVRS